MKKTIFKGILAAAIFAVVPFTKATAQSFTEGFDNITTLAGSGWFTQNNSSPVGALSWFQGTPTTATPTPGPFNAYTGAVNSYIAVNFNSTGSTGTISNWLLTPNRTFRNGDVITFYTRKPFIGAGQTDYPDRLEVRMSTNGASTNVGTVATDLGDFTTMLMSVNPTLVTGVYPQAWTQYTITISGLPAPTSGRIAFRYHVTGAGSLGTNSDYIGIDEVVYTPYVCPTFTVSPNTIAGGAAGTAYSQSLSQTGALGAPNFAVTAGALPPGLTLAANGTISGTPTATGTFNFTVTVSDNSGCSGSSAYSLTIVCPANPTSLNGLPTLCDNDSPVTLTQGSPAGGTYSGTGVSAGMFDPSNGTQTITYDYTDAYGCAHQSSNTITVNAAPTVTQDPIAAACDNGGLVALSGGLPAGGTYSGTGVSGTDFDPTNGTQTITYTYTDANNCTNEATTSITVNAAPTVTQDPIAAACDNGGLVALSGGLPAGGTYSGTGVSGSDFDPANGTQTVTYTYTDGNNCTNSADATITVNAAPTVTQDPIGAVCADAADITLSGGAPAGGTYSGTGVSGGIFDVSAGTQTVTYTYTDGNNCSNEATTTVTVNDLPTVALSLTESEVCIYDAAAALGGGTPAGGSYSGTAVTGGSFDPATAGLGTYTITYSYTDGNGCSSEDTDDITVGECLGVDEATLADLTAYPNPGNGAFHIESAGELTNIVVTDLQGKIVNAGITEDNGILIDLTAAQTGIYFLNAELNGRPVSVRLIKQ